jgi:hypothetical protein
LPHSGCIDKTGATQIPRQKLICAALRNAAQIEIGQLCYYFSFFKRNAQRQSLQFRGHSHDNIPDAFAGYKE